MPIISVIMSTKDTPEEYLVKSINSILKQTFTDFELIIVDDGSKNDSEIIKKIHDDRIVLLKNSKTCGLATSLNKAIKVSKGKYIARMDSDDISTLDRLEIQYKFMEKNNNVDICSTFTKYFGNKDGYNIEVYFDNDAIKANLFLYNCLAHPTIMIKKDFIDKNNIKYDENYSCSQDYELWSRICENANFYIIPKVCLFYRVHSKQISTEKLNIQNTLCSYIYERNLNKLKVNTNVDILFNLSLKKIDDNVLTREIVNEIIKCNKIMNVYNNKVFSRLIYFKYFYYMVIKKHKVLGLKELVKSNFIIYYIRKIFLIISCIINLKIRKINIID